MGFLSTMYSEGTKPSVKAPAITSKKPSYSKPSSAPEMQTDVVRIMQRMMGDLEIQLQDPDNKKVALEGIKKQNPATKLTENDIGRAAIGFGATSAGGTQGSYDGIWGKNTKSSLVKIKNFISSSGIKGINIQEGSGSSPYKEMSDVNIITEANANILNLNRLFKIFGLKTKVEETKKKTKSNKSGTVLDKVGRVIVTEEATTPTPWNGAESLGDIPVTTGDLRDLLTFSYFLNELSYTPCRPLENGKEEVSSPKRAPKTRFVSETVEASYEVDLKKISEEILDNSIFKLEEKRAKGVKIAQEAEKTLNASTCYHSINDFIEWFKRRSSNVYYQMNKSLNEGIHPIRGDEITDEDMKAAKQYRSLIDNIARQWERYKNDIARVLKENGMTQTPVVTPYIIEQAVRSSSDKPTGKGNKRRVSYDDGEYEQEEGYTIKRKKSEGPGAGPISDYMRLESDRYRPDPTLADRIRELSDDNRLPILNRRLWETDNWQNIAIRDLGYGRDLNNLKQRFVAYAGTLRKLIDNLYYGWENEFRDKITEDVSRNQNRELNRWERIIEAKISQAQRSR